MCIATYMHVGVPMHASASTGCAQCKLHPNLGQIRVDDWKTTGPRFTSYLTI